MLSLISLLIVALQSIAINADTSVSASSGGSSSSSSYSSNYNVLEFENYGYTGYYHFVNKIEDIDSDDCTCELSSKWTEFSGINSPLDEGVSVHFRGPLILEEFAAYTSDSFTYGDDNSGDWSRMAYYSASEQTATNVTFLTGAGDDSPCLGKALTYAGTDGVSKSESSTILAKDTLIESNKEYVIFSGEKCDDSGYDKDCGVYRSGIPAYHGFEGTIKMFLFSFQAPTESKITNTSSTNYDMPAIWLLNDHIPRTSQYPTNSNCSCWASGCGEFDIFEVLNKTESSHFFTTIHDFQGTGDMATGISVQGYLERDTSTTMKGGVAFDSKGNAIVWLSNSTSFGANVSASSVNSWISGAGTEQEKTLTSISNSKPASSGGMSLNGGFLNRYLMSSIQATFGALLFLF